MGVATDHLLSVPDRGHAGSQVGARIRNLTCDEAVQTSYPSCEEFDRSLKRPKMDNVDFLPVHSLEPTVDIAALEKGGTFSRIAGIVEMAQVQGSRSHIS